MDKEDEQPQKKRKRHHETTSFDVPVVVPPKAPAAQPASVPMFQIRFVHLLFYLLSSFAVTSA